ncbi:MAG: RNA methyltransferase, partial [Bulleidia sp.]
MKPEFEARMKDLLKDEYQAFEQEMKESPKRGYRINPLKTSAEEFFRLTGYPEDQTPFAQYAYYLPEQSGAGATAAHAAGLMYLQEPSAASAVSVLDPKPGMKVLDLCAAPGSKTTEIAGLMHNQGLLVANEISPGRAKILVENAERWGAENVMVLNADPAEVAESFPEFFDEVLCDAPCSGEGMFRKNPDAEKEWSPEGVLSCAKRQRTILSSA